MRLEKCADLQPTSASIYVPFYKYLKYVGIYPYAFEFHPVPKNFTGIHPLRKLSTQKSGLFVIFNRFVILVNFMQTLFLLAQLVWTISTQHSDSSMILNLIAWFGLYGLGLVVVVKQFMDGEAICQWITETNAMELEIYGELRNRV